MILLFGMPRSGTTWVGKVFDSHPDVHYRHEPDTHLLLNEIVPMLPELDDAERYAAGLREYCETQLAVCSSKICGNGKLFPKNYASNWASWVQRVRISLNRNLERVSGKKRYWHVAIPDGSERLAWKSIESLGRLGVLLEAIPSCHAIVIMRNPCGHIASVLRGEARGKFLTTRAADDFDLFRMLLNTEYGLKTGLTVEELKTLPEEQRLAWRWVLFYQKALDDTRNHDTCAAVRYEDLCRAPMTGYRQLFEFANLGWNDQTEQFVSASSTSESDSYYTVYRDPLKTAMKWQTELSDAQMRSIHSVIEAHPVGQAYYADDISSAHYRFIGF